MRETGVRILSIALLLSLGMPAGHAADLRIGGAARHQVGVQLPPEPSDRSDLLGAALRLPSPLWRGAEAERRRANLYPLHWVALQDAAPAAAALLRGGMPADTRDEDGRTPLMVAAAFGSPAVARLLLAHGADPRARDALNGNSPLDFAALAGHAELAELLLQRGADVNGRSRGDGETPLHYAALYGHLKMIELLVAGGADLDRGDIIGVRPLQYAWLRRRDSAAELLLSLGARPDDLHDAVNAGDLGRVQKILAQGADVNASNLFGTPLHVAAAAGHVSVAVLLIDAGADLETEGEPGAAHPLHTAAHNDQPAMAALLIRRGAESEARDSQGRTPLVVAAAYGNVAAAQALLANGADALAGEAVYRDSAMHHAVRSGDLEMVDLLLSYGVDIDIRSGHDGESPVHYAAQWNDARMVDFLIANGADPNLRDAKGRTLSQAVVGLHGVLDPAIMASLRLFAAGE